MKPQFSPLLSTANTGGIWSTHMIETGFEGFQASMKHLTLLGAQSLARDDDHARQRTIT